MTTNLLAGGDLVAGPAAARARARERWRDRVVVLGIVLAATAGIVAAAWWVAGRDTVEAPRATGVDPVVAATGAVLDRWWAGEAAALDLDWTPVGARLTDGDGTVSCDGEPIVLDEQLADNAFATWCSDGHAVAFDPARFPALSVGTQVVLAHEWGHVVQFENPQIDLPSIDPLGSNAERELQADCFAGAWAGEHVVEQFHGMMLADIGSFGDPSWVPLDHAHGHGTARERQTAYELGAAGGVVACLPPAFDPR